MEDRVTLDKVLNLLRGYAAVKYNNSYVLGTSMFGDLISHVVKNQAYSIFKNKNIRSMYVNNVDILTIEII